MTSWQAGVEARTKVMQMIFSQQPRATHVEEPLPADNDPGRVETLIHQYEKWCTITNLHHAAGLTSEGLFAFMVGDRGGGSVAAPEPPSGQQLYWICPKLPDPSEIIALVTGDSFVVPYRSKLEAGCPHPVTKEEIRYRFNVVANVTEVLSRSYGMKNTLALTIPGGDTTDYIPMIVETIQAERANPNLHVILIDMGNNRG